MRLSDTSVSTADQAMARLELIKDIGEATVLYDRLWTEVKTTSR